MVSGFVLYQRLTQADRPLAQCSRLGGPAEAEQGRRRVGLAVRQAFPGTRARTDSSWTSLVRIASSRENSATASAALPFCTKSQPMFVGCPPGGFGIR